MAARLLPGARLFYHWLWSYTIIWDKPRAIRHSRLEPKDSSSA